MAKLNISRIKKILGEALSDLYKSQPDLNEFSSETNQTEWNIAHHFANEVIKFFPGYSCDLDITKRNYNNRRPDIIIHRRGNNENNLLVIEMKRNGGETSLNSDKNKIKQDWFDKPLSYKFGAVVNIFTSNRADVIKVFENEEID